MSTHIGLIRFHEATIAVPEKQPVVESLVESFGFSVGPEIVQEEAPEQIRFRNLTVLGQPSIAVIEPTAADSPVGRFLDRNRPGLFSLSFRVGDLARYSELLRATGVKLLFDEPKRVVNARIGEHVYPQAVINWVPPQPATGGVLFELQEIRD